MKMKFNAVLMLVLSVLAFACKKDNYDEPTSMLSGKIMYQGEPIQVEFGQVPFDLFQYGFGKIGAIGSAITPEGTYSHVLFDGEYKFVINQGQGPFIWPSSGGKSDSLTITVNGNTTFDVEVIPYYMIRNAQISGNATTITSTFSLEKIVTDPASAKDIERVNLYVNKSQFVSGATNLGNTQLAGSAITNPASISMSIAVPTITPAQNYIYARIGVKIAGVEDMLFSPVQKITF